jgi:hypothetical protein
MRDTADRLVIMSTRQQVLVAAVNGYRVRPGEKFRVADEEDVRRMSKDFVVGHGA